MRRIILCCLITCLLFGTASADTLLVSTSGTSDGGIRLGCNIPYQDCHDAATGSVVLSTDQFPNTWLKFTTTDPDVEEIERIYLQFNASVLPDDCTITDATLGVIGGSTGKNNGAGITGWNVVKFTPATLGTAVIEDFDQFGSTAYATELAYADATFYPDVSYNNWTFNAAGLSNISKTDWSAFGIIDNFDLTDTTPDFVSGGNTYWYLVMSEYGSLKPALTIFYTEGGDPPVASFSCDHTFLRIPQPVTCTDTSSESPDEWLWDFGDGTTSTDQSPVHKYTKRGVWDVTLTATNDDGSDESDITTVRVVGYDTHT